MDPVRKKIRDLAIVPITADTKIPVSGGATTVGAIASNSLSNLPTITDSETDSNLDGGSLVPMFIGANAETGKAGHWLLVTSGGLVNGAGFINNNEMMNSAPIADESNPPVYMLGINAKGIVVRVPIANQVVPKSQEVGSASSESGSASGSAGIGNLLKYYFVVPPGDRVPVSFEVWGDYRIVAYELSANGNIGAWTGVEMTVPYYDSSHSSVFIAATTTLRKGGGADIVLGNESGKTYIYELSRIA